MFAFNHYNYNVLDLEKSMAFYEAALGLKEVRRKEAGLSGRWQIRFHSGADMAAGQKRTL